MAQRTVNIGIGNQVVQNDFDGLPIYKEMEEVTDDYGNKFIRIPKFYIHKENTAGKLAIRISKEPISGGYLPHCFYDHVANKELSYIDVGKYLASLSTDGTKLESKSGVKPLVSKTITEFRNLAKANGSGYQQLDIHVIDVLQCLFYVEFATLNSQSIHPGFTDGTESTATGGTDGVVASSGAVGANAWSQFKYRGIEDLWGNVWRFVDGVNILDNQAYVVDNANQYASDVFVAPYKKLSYKNATDNGYVKDMGFDPNNPSAMFPIALVGEADSENYYSDHYSQGVGQCTAQFGGAWSHTGKSGTSNWIMNSESSHSAISTGGRLVRKPM